MWKEFKIDKDVPIPEQAAANRNLNGKWPFLRMEEGESFFVPGTTVKRMRASTANFRHVNKNDWKFAFKEVEEKFNEQAVKGCRVWLVKKTEIADSDKGKTGAVTAAAIRNHMGQK